MESQTPDAAKRRAAGAALKLVTPGMRLGLGTGSTTAHFIDLLGAQVAQGLDVLCVPTSERTRAQAQSLAIPLSDFDALSELDMTVDGADEFDPQLRLIKGGGGALWREKIVASTSKRMIVIADSSKAVARLGKFPLPVEISRFGAEATRVAIVKAA
ncbi:MAG TPA: ribose-5-phosphate isomerase RpiA, partial [Methylovirgula sp.]